MSEKQTSEILAFVFGVIFLAALLLFVLFVPNPTPPQFEVIRIILALVGGGVAAMIPGFLNLQLAARAALMFRAGGVLAVFAIVYFYSPARWSVSPISNITQKTTGPDSPAIAGNHNEVGSPATSEDKAR